MGFHRSQGVNSGAPTCPICQSKTSELGSKQGSRFGQAFQLRACPACTFKFVANPSTDYAAIYDERYYAGQGSDPLVDYAAEYTQPRQTVRRHDWEGIEQVVTTLRPNGGRWLDYGCGNGALVRHIAGNKRWAIAGHDIGAWATRARRDQLPILNEQELAAQQGTFDVITAIEVVEHVVDPVAFLTGLRRLARPGALLFITTQNANAAPGNFVSWDYVRPEIHVSFFTPQALATALEKSGFQPTYPGFVSGWEKIIRFKVLKNLGIRRHATWHALLGWPLLARVVDARYEVTKLPAGIAL